MIISLALLLVGVSFTITTMLVINARNTIREQREKLRTQQAYINRLKRAIQLSRPIVGAAASGNEERPKRQAVYDRITVVLKKTE